MLVLVLVTASAPLLAARATDAEDHGCKVLIGRSYSIHADVTVHGRCHDAGCNGGSFHERTNQAIPLALTLMVPKSQGIDLPLTSGNGFVSPASGVLVARSKAPTAEQELFFRQKGPAMGCRDPHVSFIEVHNFRVAGGDIDAECYP